MINLYDCLLSYFKPQELNQDGNLYYCSVCDSKCFSTQYYKIKDLPDVLIINLKRFKYSYWGSKISTHVDTPMTLNLDEFSKEPGPNYYLSCIIQHKGLIFKGHYIAFCKDFVNDTWYEYNDKKVKEVNVEKVRSAQVYVAIYTKFPVKRPKIVSQGADFYIPKEWLYRYYSLSNPGPLNFQKYYCTHSFLNIQTKEYDLVPISTEQLNKLKNEVTFQGEPLRFKNSCYQCSESKELLIARINFEKNLRESVENVSKEFPRFFISTSWLKEWETFLSWDPLSDFSPISPGPIANSCLLDKSEDVREGLSEKIDYIHINEELWIILKELYDCDVSIIKEHGDIYSNTICGYQLSDINEETEEIISRFRRYEKMDYRYR